MYDESTQTSGYKLRLYKIKSKHGTWCDYLENCINMHLFFQTVMCNGKLVFK